jgi:hypothetical protein
VVDVTRSGNFAGDLAREGILARELRYLGGGRRPRWQA